MLALGIVLVVVALVLLVAEAHISTAGVLGLAGGTAIVCGLVLLTAASAAGGVAVIAVGAGAAVVTIGGLTLLLKGLDGARGRPQSGPATMVGHHGVLRVTSGGKSVFVDGALWRAEPSPLCDPDGLRDGDQVIVEQMSGLTLYVRRAEELELNP